MTKTLRDFGATGDGVSDDRRAVQAALDSGEVLVAERGTYLIGPPGLRVTRPTWMAGGATFRPVNGNFHVFTLLASGVEFSDFAISGGALSDSTAQYAITSGGNALADVRLSRLAINSTNNGVKADAGCRDWSLDSLRMTGLVGSNKTGVGYGFLCAGQRCRVANGTFDGFAGHGRHAVYLTAGASDCRAENNDVFGFNEQGIQVYATATQSPCQRNIIRGNRLRQCGSGRPETGSIHVTGNVQQTLIDNNDVSGSRGYALAVVYGPNLGTVASGNRFTDSLLGGVLLAGTEDCTLSGNTIDAFGFQGIRLTSHGTFGTRQAIGTRITGNVIRGESVTSILISARPIQPADTDLHGNQCDGAINPEGVTVR